MTERPDRRPRPVRPADHRAARWTTSWPAAEAVRSAAAAAGRGGQRRQDRQAAPRRLLADSLLECDVILLADGQSVVWASRLLGRPLPERVAGIDLFERLLELADRDHARSTCSGRARRCWRAAATHRRAVPRVVIAGRPTATSAMTRRPPSRPTSAASGADMLFLGMTSPKKEIFLGTLRRRARRPGPARCRRLVRRPRRGHQARAGGLAAARHGVALPPAAGATSPVAALPRHQQRVHLP